jgi:glycosyltransferase involved in cell wall biosynthesis
VKILLAHEYYQSAQPSGEDSMFRSERELLRGAGHEVISYEVHNDNIGTGVRDRVGVALATPWSRQTQRALGALLARERPQIAHFHNTFPLISPSAYRACRDAGVRVVQTLHNYRLVCPAGLLQRAGAPCEDCVGRTLLPAIRHRCYRGSLPGTAVAAAMLLFNRARGSYANDVDRYIVLTEFGREVLARGGLPAAKLVVRPNGLTDDPGAGDGRGGFALYAGRLSAEKGVGALVEAWRSVPGAPLVIAGDGALRSRLEAQARAARIDVRFLGQQPRTAILALMREARLVVLPSECYEGLPVTYVEALAAGAPVAASRLGALAEILNDGENGVHFPAANPPALAAAVNGLLADATRLARIRVANRRLFEDRYSPRAALRSLEDIYRSVLPAAA